MANTRPRHAIGKHRKPSKTTIEIICDLFKTKQKVDPNAETIIMPAIQTP